MIPQPPAGQGPVDPRGAFSPPPPPRGQYPTGPGNPPPNVPSAPLMPPMYPPPMMMPPMMYPPPRPRGGLGYAIVVAVMTAVFGLSILFNFYCLIFAGLFRSDTGPTETVIRDGGTDKIAVIPLNGIIDDGMVAHFGQFLQKAEQDNKVKAIVIEIDSPGGGVGASDRIHHMLQKFKSEHQLKIAISIGDLGASGGYYVACAGDQIFAQSTALTGSIGVVSPNYDLTGLAEKIGVRDRSTTAPAGGYKTAGSMLNPLSDRDKAYWQNLIDQTFSQFTSVVKKGRSGRLKAPDSEIFNAKVFTASDALKNGLIDQIGYLEDACDWAAKQAGISSPTIVKYQRRATFFDFVRGSADSGQSTAKGNMVVNVTVDSRLIDELTTPRLQYLWKGQ